MVNKHEFSMLHTVLMPRLTIDNAFQKNEMVVIGDRKDGVCLRFYSQKSSSRRAAISAMLDQKGRAFVLIQVPYTLKSIVSTIS